MHSERDQFWRMRCEKKESQVHDPMNKCFFEDNCALFFICDKFQENQIEISQSVIRP